MASDGKHRIRHGNEEASIVRVAYRVTPEERAEHHALADYLQTTVSELIRRLMIEERARLVASGKRPPRR